MASSGGAEGKIQAASECTVHGLTPFLFLVRLLLTRIMKIVALLFTAMIALQTLGVPIAPLLAGVGIGLLCRVC